MSLYTIDLKKELSQISDTTSEIIDKQFRPLLENLVNHAGHKINHQREKASLDVKEIIDHAASRLEESFSTKLDQMRLDATRSAQIISRSLTFLAMAIAISSGTTMIFAVLLWLKIG